MGIAIIIAIAIILVFAYVGIYNTIKKYEIKVDESLSGIDVALTNRYDSLTKLFDVVKGYMEHEKSVLETITNLRKPNNTDTIKEKEQKELEMSNAVKQINLTAEAYPELNSSENFKALQVRIAEVEDQLAASRRIYNSNVSRYNSTIVTFPNSIVAGNMNATSKEFFELEDKSKREDVEMKF